MSLFAKKSPEDIFWKWFSENESKYFELEKDQENLLSQLSSKLTKYQDGATYEISTKDKGIRELIISADGLKEIFPVVEQLVSSAPKLDRWKVIAFRPRQADYMGFILNYSGEDFDPKKLWFYYRIEDGYFDLLLYHPTYTEEKRNLYIGAFYILLDSALGEYDVTMNLRYIDHAKLPDEPKEAGLTPFSELREVFDTYKMNYPDKVHSR
ncbi:hypothetical protein [Sulfurovum mangrovi]|uniref:hypothetical protein n=1 Tax=Sulfurovum mangrovi TaxID=2893889 RepID=UPI001E37EAF5|nr:hypothetical protein [Sulfurovum mangrovi]UFH60289.1 hypothetical protein LN246_05420 [Sulfurovum mangrovi]